MVYCMVLTTVPNQETGQQLAQQLIDSRLAACVSMLGPIQSTYRWQGTVECEAEYQLLIKTTQAAQAQVFAHITAHHPYEVPELLALPILAASALYGQWIDEQVTSSPSQTEG